MTPLAKLIGQDVLDDTTEAMRAITLRRIMICLVILNFHTLVAARFTDA